MEFDKRTVSIGTEKAIALANTRWWVECSHEEIVRFQLFTRELCMPFEVFHEAMEKTLGRPVWTHEFGSCGRLVDEFLGTRGAPSMEEILGMIPQEKLVIVGL